MRKLVLIIHTSLDGYVAAENGSLDGFEVENENLEFVCGLTETADAAMMGRISWQLLDEYWPGAKDQPDATKQQVQYSNWYNMAEKIVISKTLKNGEHVHTRVIGSDIPAAVKTLKEQEGKDILLFGSPSVAQLLMRENLIDSYWICINPVIFGKGIPLFADLKNPMKLKLVSTKQLPNGELALNYTVST